MYTINTAILVSHCMLWYFSYVYKVYNNNHY